MNNPMSSVVASVSAKSVRSGIEIDSNALPFLVFVFLSLIVFDLFAADLIVTYCSGLFFVLLSYFILQKKVNLFNPFTLFTFYYFTVIPVFLYLHFTNFSKSLYLTPSDTRSDLTSLLGTSIIYTTFAYVFTFIGYRAFKSKVTAVIDFEDGISLKITNVFIVLFAIIGLSNFVYNVMVFAGGNPLVYISNIAIRKLEFEEFGGTTIGYHFSFTAAYLWLYKLMKTGKSSLFFFIYVLLTLLIKATTGRVTATIFYGLTFVGAYYIVNFEKLHRQNKRYLFLFALVCLFGILFFLLRIVSSLSFNEMMEGSWLVTLSNLVTFDLIMFLAVDMGNAPNVAVLMKIIESWGSDIGFLYGSSLFSWLYSFLPMSFRPEDYQVSFMIRNTWYPTLPGSLPPTGVGEMYANFGVFGPFVGMFAFGAFIALVRNLLNRFNNFWYLIIFLNISLYFVMIYPKGEFDNMSVLHIAPMLITYLSLRSLTQFGKIIKYKKI